MADLLQVPRIDRERAYPPVPLVSWALVALAGVHVLVQLLGDGIIGPLTTRSLTPGYLLAVLGHATPFLVAAALVAGAGGWPHGQQLLRRTAVLWVVAGLCQLALDAWWAAHLEPGGGFSLAPESTAWMPWVGGLGSAAESAGAMLVAVGLWRGRSPDAGSRAWRRPVMASLGLVALITAGENLLLLTRLDSGAGTAIVLILSLEAVQVAAIAVIGAVALAVMPKIAWLPEGTVALGVGLTVLGRLVIGLVEVMPSGGGSLVFGIYSWSYGIAEVGMLVMALGLSLGRLVAPRERGVEAGAPTTAQPA